MTAAPPASQSGASAIVQLLCSSRYTYSDETELQGLLVDVLSECHQIQREVRLTPRCRIDLIVDGRVGIEVKIDGSAVAVAQQIQRYARTGRLEALVLATTRIEHASLPAELGGLQVSVAYLAPWLS